MTKQQVGKTLVSFGALALIFSIVCAILYFMRLSIFDRRTLEWTFVYGLAAAALGFSALLVWSIWDA
jgi:cytochrome b subunit of formate dehydrogenase